MPPGGARLQAWLDRLEPGVVAPPGGTAALTQAAFDLSEDKQRGIKGGRAGMAFLAGLWQDRGVFLAGLKKRT